MDNANSTENQWKKLKEVCHKQKALREQKGNIQIKSHPNLATIPSKMYGMCSYLGSESLLAQVLFSSQSA